MDETDEAIWKEELKEYVQRCRVLKGNMATIHAVIWGQCSEAMRAKIKAHKGYEERTEDNDCFWLLKQVKAVTLQFDQKRNCFISLMNAKASFYNCKQQEGQTADSYREEMKGWVDTIEYHGGCIAESYELVPEFDDNGAARSIPERKSIACDRTLGIAYIRGADTTRYGTLIREMANRYARGKDEYPVDLDDAYSAIVNYATPTNTGGRTRIGGSVRTAPTAFSTVTPEGSAMTFAQQTAIPGTNGMTYPTVTCFNCQSIGHYSDHCPSDDNGTAAGTSTTSDTGTTLLQHAYMLAQSIASGIDPGWILLDSQSTISVFRNKDMLTKVRRSPHVLRAITNGGYQDSDMVGDFPNLEEVWYNPASIANILSLSDVSKICRVTMDTTTDKAMCINRIDGTIMKFAEHSSGLYVFATNGSSNKVNAYTMLSTVAEQKKMFSKREIHAADAARALYRKLGRPAEADFRSMLRGNLIRNCPVTADDAQRALTIYGPDVATLKGKMAHDGASVRTPTFDAVPLPPSILKHHRNVTLCVDFFFCQGHAFFHTIFRGIGFRTVSSVPNRHHDTILRELHLVLDLYRARGFNIVDVHADNEFECVKEELRPIHMDNVPADRHIGEIERSVKTVKERLRSTAHGLPFKRIPKLLVTHIVADAVRCLNQFPWANGISANTSPLSIVTGAAAPDYNNMRVELGQYVQVFEPSDPTNTPKARSLGSIALTSTGNANGDYYFFVSGNRCPYFPAPMEGHPNHGHLHRPRRSAREARAPTPPPSPGARCGMAPWTPRRRRRI